MLQIAPLRFGADNINNNGEIRKWITFLGKNWMSKLWIIIYYIIIYIYIVKCTKKNRQKWHESGTDEHTVLSASTRKYVIKQSK